MPRNREIELGYLWTCARPGGDTVFTWQTGRPTHYREHIVPARWQGTVQSDGDAAYPAFVRVGNEAITLAGCWAHARRAILRKAAKVRRRL